MYLFETFGGWCNAVKRLFYQMKDKVRNIFVYVGDVTKPVVTKSFACLWGTVAQWAQALTEEGLLAVLEGFADEEQTIEEFAEHGEPDREAFAELHRRLLTDEGELQRIPEPGEAAIILRSLRRAVTLASPEQILVDLKEGRWSGEASLLLRCEASSGDRAHPGPPYGR